jgi:Fe-S-cluster-containing hydrogenase component 2/CRP-like cAMP-binding protein
MAAPTLLNTKIRTTATARDDDEGVLNRDAEGNLIRQDDPSVEDYNKVVKLKIDGQEVEINLAQPLKDAAGIPVLDVNGNTTPRFSTILDAALKLYGDKMGERASSHIPVLCHQPHMTPVAVCRMCTVQIYGEKRGEFKPERKLLPACQYPVKKNMEVYTMMSTAATCGEKHAEDGELVSTTARTLTELLASKHLKPAKITPELSEYNELGKLSRQCEADTSRFSHKLFSEPMPELKIATTFRPTANPPGVPGLITAPAVAPVPEGVPHNGPYGFDSSSPVFEVDHSACILCDRCVRACGEVKHNNIIGRTGKGAKAAIGFDLDVKMGDSGCVQCGECMVSCPTTAISFKPVGQVNISRSRVKSEVIGAKELLADPIFQDIPAKFLFWQQGLVVRRKFRAGDVLARQGDPGNTAFVIKSGKLKIRMFAPAPGGRVPRNAEPIKEVEVTPEKMMVGEMACLSGQARSGDIVATEDGEAWELRRNVLDRLMRLPDQHARIEKMYQNRALELIPSASDIFKGLPPDESRKLTEYLLDNAITFVRVPPGRTIMAQGEIASNFFIVRMGYVRVKISVDGREAYRVVSRGPGAPLGEIGLLGLTYEDLAQTEEETDRKLQRLLANAGDDITQALPPGRYSATVTAIDYVEMARMNRADFLRMVQKFPLIRQRLIRQTFSRLREDNNPNVLVEEFSAQGLYEARSVLVLDLDRCTRCDECTRGCVKSHGTHTHGVPLARLMRDGMRFGQYLVATSCRSCETPHCMTGCPVDAIHRGRHMQIVIEDHCIGCGLCEKNCPYGSITIQPNFKSVHHAGEKPRNKAVNCDLCDSHDERSTPNPMCVASCPHDAAFRFTGPELLHKVLHAANDDD